jgi:hypothetical protein
MIVVRGQIRLREVAIQYTERGVGAEVLGFVGGINEGAFEFRPGEKINQHGGWRYYNVPFLSPKRGQQMYSLERPYATDTDECFSRLNVQVNR